MVGLVAGGSSYFTTLGLKDAKYLSAKKPSWYPPGYVFGIVWTIIYLLYSYSWFEASVNTNVNILYYSNMILNFLWCFFFFYLKKWDFSLLILILLSINILAQIFMGYNVSKTGSLLLIPYFLWSLFASYLNYTIIRLNK